MTRPVATILLTLALAAPALAQSAWVEVSHNDPDGLVEPGQTIKVRVDVTWSPGTTTSWYLFAGLAGNVLPSPSAGTSANNTSLFPTGGPVNHGIPTSGGVVGLDIAITPTFGMLCFPSPPPVTGPTSLVGPVLSFDWTAPTDLQGPISFEFTPQAGTGVRVYRTSPPSPSWIPAQTTFIPATLTITPTPGTAIAFGALAPFLFRRST